MLLYSVTCRELLQHASQTRSSTRLTDHRYMEFQSHRLHSRCWHLLNITISLPNFAQLDINRPSLHRIPISHTSLPTRTCPHSHTSFSNSFYMDTYRPSLHRIPFLWPTLYSVTGSEHSQLAYQFHSTWTSTVRRYIEFQFHDNQLTCWHLLTTHNFTPKLRPAGHL